MNNNPNQGPESNLGEDNEKLFQKKKAGGTHPAAPGSGEKPSRIYTKPAAKETTPAYANRRSGRQDNDKANAAAPTVKINTASTAPKTPMPNRPVQAAKPTPVPAKSVPKVPVSSKEAPAYTARRAAENVAPTPSQSYPTASANDKKTALPKFGADLMANSVKAIT